MAERFQIDERTERRVETLATPLVFDKLFSLVEEVALSSPLHIPEAEPLSNEARVVAELGLRGLRTAIEFTQGSVVPLIRHGNLTMKNDDQIRSPEAFSDRVDTAVLRKTEALGEALLEESFAVLGVDATAQAERLRNAMDCDEQYDVIEWLCNRLSAITENENAVKLQNEGDDRFFHPLRLSPRLMGSYPSPTVAPTCLGVSMLATSFFKKAGIETLHAGVMRTRAEQQRMSTIDLFGCLPELAVDSYGFQFPEKFTDSLDIMSRKLLHRNLENNGYHAAVFAKLGEDHWCQVDTNFSANTAIDDEYLVGQLNDSLKTLKDMHEVALGLEVGVEFPHATLAQIIRVIIQHGNASFLPDKTEVETFLLDGDVEAFYERAKVRFAEPFFKEHGNEELRDMMWNLMDQALFDEVFHSIFTKYVLHSEPAHKVLERCGHDSSYLRNRIDDIHILPLMLAAGLAIADVNNGRDMGLHQSFEVGLPEVRVGSAVLNDFANLYAKDLSPGFRISHWPSHVPLTDAYPGSRHAFIEEPLRVRNILGQLGRLHYTKDDGKVYRTVIEQQ